MLWIIALEWFGCSFLGLLLLWVFNWTNVCNNFKDEPWKMVGCNLVLFMGGPFSLCGSIMHFAMEHGWLRGLTMDTTIKSEDEPVKSTSASDDNKY